MNRHLRRQKEAQEKRDAKRSLPIIQRIQRRFDRAIEETSCGSCDACCTTMRVEEIHKPEEVRCPSLLEQGGCGVYGQHPAMCRDFYCLWRLKLPQLTSEGHRPDKLGVIFTPPSKGQVPMVILAHATRPGAFDEPAASAVLHHLIGNGYAVIAREGVQRRLLCDPSHEAACLVRDAASASLT